MGNYSGATDYLYHFRILSTDADLNTSAHWGKLSSDILIGNWDVALEELNSLRDAIDSRSTPLPASASAADPAALGQLHARTWWLHWSLFIYFNHDQGRTLLLETFLSPTYLNTIQTSCPWILRYLVVASILSRKAPSPSSRVRHSIREIVKIVQMEEYQYTDPVTTFLRELYVEFDFEAAQKALKDAEKVVANDFFLDNFGDDFMDNARYLISEAYCRIHQRIDIGCVPWFHLSLGRVLGLDAGLEMGRASELAGFAIDPPLGLLGIIPLLAIASGQLCSVLQLNANPR